MRSTFVKWFILVGITTTALFLGEQKGALSLIITNDASYISILIMSLFVGMSIFLGVLAYHSDTANTEERAKLLKRTEVAHFAADHMFTLGLLGTMIGLCMATSGSLVTDTVVKDIVAGLKTGLNTSFYTTIAGLVFSLLLQLQLLVLKGGLEE
jgi:putative copper export protein